MDNIDCLKKLTEDIVKKQNDSLESVNSLCRLTDTVRSDISNLINSLQMVGNRQFAENRIQNEDLSNCGRISSSSSRQQQQSKNTLSNNQQVPEELKLSSILLRAIQSVPKSIDNSLLHANEIEDCNEGAKEVVEDEEEEEKEEEEEVKKKAQSIHNRIPIDRERITDILKRYSLFDDDEDNDDDESDE